MTFLLLESGGYFLLESGGKLILEFVVVAKKPVEKIDIGTPTQLIRVHA